MFNKLSELFVSNKPTNVHKLPVDESLTLLRKLKQNNSRLLVQFENGKRSFQSIVISINKLNNTLIMDEFFPPPETQIQKGAIFNCQLQENGCTTSFTSSFIDKIQSSGSPALLMSYPSSVKHEQRRDNFRLTVKPGQILSAKIGAEYQATLSGIIKDISNHGLRINIHADSNDSIRKGDILQSCLITLDNNESITCQLTVRSKQSFSRPYHFTQIGTEITDIQLSDRQLLSQYVSQQQRLQCRLRATDRL